MTNIKLDKNNPNLYTQCRFILFEQIIPYIQHTIHTTCIKYTWSYWTPTTIRQIRHVHSKISEILFFVMVSIIITKSFKIDQKETLSLIQTMLAKRKFFTKRIIVILLLFKKFIEKKVQPNLF